MAKWDTDYLEFCRTTLRGKKHTRDALAGLLAALRDGDTLVVFDQTRLCRPHQNSPLKNVLFQQLAAKRVKIFQARGGWLDPADSTSQLVSDITSKRDDETSNLALDKCRRVLATKKASGLLVSGPSFYGARSAGRQQVEWIPEQVKVVKEIFKTFASGKGLHVTAKLINDAGHRRRNGTEWTYRLVKSLLMNPAYVGHRRDADGTLVPVKPLGNGIIDRTLFDNCQNRLSVGKKYRQTRVPHPLAGLLYCPCGRSLYLHKSEGRMMYRCGSFWTSSRHCKTAIRADSTSFGCGLEKALEPLSLGGWAERCKAQEGRPELRSRLLALDGERADIQRLSNILAETLANGGSIESYEKGTAILAKRRAVAEQEKKAVREELAVLDAPLPNVRRVPMTNEIYRDVIHQLVTKVVVEQAKLTVHFHSGKTLALPRTKVGNGWVLPRPDWKWKGGKVMVMWGDVTWQSA
jgi:DNA invertase Pin-like site-specific DNA recombinase